MPQSLVQLRKSHQQLRDHSSIHPDAISQPPPLQPSLQDKRRTASPLPPHTQRYSRLARTFRTPKGSLAAAFIMLGILGVASTGLARTIPHLLIAVLGATSADIIFAALERRKPYFPSSAILSGLIVGFILVPIEPRLITFAVGALASITKHLLRTERGHIFNPAALALVLSVPIFNTGQSWWGALSNLPGIFAIIVLALSIAILSRVNKFPMAISFLGVYFGLFSIVGIADPTRVAEMFRVPFINAAIFLAGFMLTDPPTSPGRINDQIWIGGLVATISVVTQLAGVGQSYLLIGILGGNLALVVSRWLRHNGQRFSLPEESISSSA